MLTLAATNTIQGSAGTASAITYTIFGMEFSGGVETYKVLAQGQLGSSVAAIYTVPSSTTTFVKSVILANTTSSAVSAVKLLVNGSSVGNQIIPSIQIPANGMAILDDNGIKVYDSNGNIFTSNTNIFDSTSPLATTTGSGSSGSSLIAARRDHVHQSPGGIAALTSSLTISNTETQVVGATIPANFCTVGTTFRVTVSGKTTTTPSGGGDYVNFKIRIGTASLTGASQTLPCFINDPAGYGFEVTAMLTMSSIGTSGSGKFSFKALSDDSGTMAFVQPAYLSNLLTWGFNTTVQNVMELTAATSSAGSSVSFGVGLIEVVKL